MKDYYAGLVAVDEMIGKLFAHLEHTGELDNTAILHSSDHGYFLGELRMFDKRLMYEPSIRVPMMRSAIQSPSRLEACVRRWCVDIDIAPTLLEIAGVKPRNEMQGKSMVKLANAGDPNWRKEWLYDYYEYPGFEDVRPHRGIRTETHKLMHFHTVDEWEMYDIANDPEEKNNLYNIPAHSKKKEEIKVGARYAYLKRHRNCPADQLPCTHRNRSSCLQPAL